MVTPRDRAIGDLHKIQTLIKEKLSECPLCQFQDFTITLSSTSIDIWEVECKSCKTSWELVVDQTTQFLKLIHASDKQKEFYLQNSWLPLSFWKTPKFEKMEKAFPVIYVEGHPKYDRSSDGSIVFSPNALFIVALNGMNLEIPWDNLSNAELLTQDEIKLKRVLLTGVLPGILWKKIEYYLTVKFLEEDIERTFLFVPVKRDMLETLDLKSSKHWDFRTLMEDLNSRRRRKEEASKEEVLDPFKVLQLRYVKGEITKEQFEEMKKVLQSG